MRKLALTVLLALLVSPGVARADGLLTPFAGVLFNPDDPVVGSLDTQTQPTFGVAVGFMIRGFVGFEYDFSFTRDYFVEDAFVRDNNLITSMFNLIVGYPLSGAAEYGPSIRPYGSGGIGVVTASIDGPNNELNFRDTDFAGNVGGGVIVFFTDRIGARGDIRYFKILNDPDEATPLDVALGKYDFLRGVFGVVIRY